MNAGDAGLYQKLKEAILQRYDITEESYRQCFRACKRKEGESNREVVTYEAWRLVFKGNEDMQGC